MHIHIYDKWTTFLISGRRLFFPFLPHCYDNSKNLHYFGNSFLINLIKKIDEEVYKLYFHELTKKEIKTYLTS